MIRMFGGALVALALLAAVAAAQNRAPKPAVATLPAPINLNTATSAQGDTA